MKKCESCIIELTIRQRRFCSRCGYERELKRLRFFRAIKNGIVRKQENA